MWFYSFKYPFFQKYKLCLNSSVSSRYFCFLHYYGLIPADFVWQARVLPGLVAKSITEVLLITKMINNCKNSVSGRKLQCLRSISYFFHKLITTSVCYLLHGFSPQLFKSVGNASLLVLQCVSAVVFFFKITLLSLFWHYFTVFSLFHSFQWCQKILLCNLENDPHGCTFASQKKFDSCLSSYYLLVREIRIFSWSVLQINPALNDICCSDMKWKHTVLEEHVVQRQSYFG